MLCFWCRAIRVSQQNQQNLYYCLHNVKPESGSYYTTAIMPRLHFGLKVGYIYIKFKPFGLLVDPPPLPRVTEQPKGYGRKKLRTQCYIFLLRTSKTHPPPTLAKLGVPDQSERGPRP
jgi:hypothetical protein